MMADMVRQKDYATYLARAEEARAEAEGSTLENVRERCLRAEAAWLAMAAKSERTERMRATTAAEKAGRAA